MLLYSVAQERFSTLASNRRSSKKNKRRLDRAVGRRLFSAGKGGASTITDDAKPATSEEKGQKESVGGGNAQLADMRTEKDFAEYLIGKSDRVPPLSASAGPLPSQRQTPESAEAPPYLPSSPSADDEWLQLHRHQASRPMHDLNETYRYIEQNQKNNLAKARAITAANVRRALGGNMIICAAKLGAWISSGSSSMLSEFVHSVVDCGNQALLLLGLRDSGMEPDRKHPYGYGKSVYFWALVSALGTFFLGAGVSMTHAVRELLDPSLQHITWHVWSVLGVSLAVDGWVLGKTVWSVRETMPPGESFWTHASKIRDPATLAILLEDSAACLGIVMATVGIAATHATGTPVFDGLAGVGISGLLASMGIVLVRVNHRFLLGQGVDREITSGIEKILLNRRSIDNVHSVQSQWTGPDTFSYKAEVDFDGTFLAAKLMPRYQREFLEVRDTLHQDLRVLLSWYAEDVMRTVEREVHHIEAEIRKEYPGAEYIELEPMSKDANRLAIDDGMEAQLRRIEIEALNRYLKSLYQVDATKNAVKTSDGDGKKDEKEVRNKRSNTPDDQGRPAKPKPSDK